MDDVTFVPVRHKLTVDAYYRMGEAGIFGEDDRIELIDGDLIDMAPIGQDHAAAVTGLNEALVLACVGRANVSPQNPVYLDETSAPQPDFAVLRRRADLYATGERPGPADILLLVEVADTSLTYDKTVKLPLYARAGIAEVWIVDLKRRVLLAFRKPAAGAYQETTTHHAGEDLALTLAPDIVVKLNLFFGD
jgi:Uma2 family endonuclease